VALRCVWSTLPLRTARFSFLLLFFFGFSPVGAYDLTVEVQDTTAYPGSTGMITIFITNPLDTIAAFEMRLSFSRPGMLEFIPDSSGGLQYDRAGTVLENWEFVSVRSQNGSPYVAKFVAIANTIALPNTPGAAPSSDPQVLIRIPFYAQTIPDTLTDRIVEAVIDDDFSGTGFSRSDGTLIGTSYDSSPDTVCLQCLVWSGSTCLLWQKAASPPCDSLEIIPPSVPILDTTKVSLITGRITVWPSCVPIQLAGDVNDDGNAGTAADIIMLSQFIAGGGSPPLPNPRNADVNGDCRINWSDVDLIQRKFQFGEQVTLASCTCLEPAWYCCIADRGNVDMDPGDVVDVADLSYLVDFLFTSGPAPVCPDEANINGDIQGTIDIADLTDLVDYLFGGGASPPSCP
jgi:hypothetical protein